MNNKTNLISNDKCWMEHTALAQLDNVACLPGVMRAVGLPDLHAGKTPVGIAVETEGRLYPHLIGNDIGCGMGLFQTNCALRKYKQDKFVAKLNHIRALEDLPCENPYDEENPSHVIGSPSPSGLSSPCVGKSVCSTGQIWLQRSPIYDLGTIGGGNHFAEFQTVDTVEDEDAFATLGIDKRRLLLLVHSGSRGYGQRILSEFSSYKGLAGGSPEAGAYLAKHDDALLWAKRNRLLVAQKLMGYLGFSPEVQTKLDCHHNFLEKRDGIYIHRKGAVSALNGLVILPGSRGSHTYILKPAEDTSASAFSLSHGAGRKWARSLCKSRIRNKYDRDTIRQTRLGSRTVCHDTDLLFQEAPEAYKNIEHVVAALSEHGLANVVATLRPLITYKG